MVGQLDIEGAQVFRGEHALVNHGAAGQARQVCRDKRVALRIEHAVKQLDRRQKLALDARRLQAIARVARTKLREMAAR